MYRNIVFDLGGVVVDYNPKDYLADKFFHEVTEKKLYDAVFGSEEWQLLDRGEITWEEAFAIFMKRGRDKDIEFEMQALLESWTEMLTVRRPTIVLMKLLKKKGFNLYYLSNVSQDVLNLLSRKGFWKFFSGGVASCEVRSNKPDMRIYEALLGKYGLAPEETIFTDDKKANAAAAFNAGITGIQFKNVKGLCKMLVTYGIDV